MRQTKRDELVRKALEIFYRNGFHATGMDMLVAKDNLGFGLRSWRYSMLVDDGKIVKMFIEPGKEDNCPTDPFEVSDADTMLAFIRGQGEAAA